VQFTNEPTTQITDSQVTVSLRTSDNTTDAGWRSVFNEEDQASKIDAEGMGGRSGKDERTVVVVRFDKGVDHQQVGPALEVRSGDRSPGRRRSPEAHELQLAGWPGRYRLVESADTGELAGQEAQWLHFQDGDLCPGGPPRFPGLAYQSPCAAPSTACPAHVLRRIRLVRGRQDNALTCGKTGQGIVEVAGIEPASSGFSVGLLRAQPVLNCRGRRRYRRQRCPVSDLVVPNGPSAQPVR
jgi:hypothetical protein